MFNLPSDQFRKEILEMGGTSAGVLSNDTLMDFFEPILRSDFEAVENYVYRPGNFLNIPITLFYGSQEEAVMDSAHLWKLETSREFTERKMEGNHFFLFQHTSEMAVCLSNLLGINSHYERCLFY
jgi:surfactin synthase thioesterase subunit